MRAFELLSLGLSVAHAATLVARDTTISSSKRDPTYNQALGQANSLTTVNAGVTYWLSGGSTHIFRGNLNNFGTIIASQTDYLKQNPYAGGQTVNFVGTTTSNGNLVNNAGAVISINDYGSISAPTYDWYLHSMENYGSLQFCGRGDTGGSTYQLYCDLDCHNYGVIDFEQYNKNLGAAFVWRNTIVGSNPGVNIYNEGAFRLVNVVHHNVQNVLGSGCWVVDSGAVLYLEDGSGLFQNPTKGPTFPNQKIFFSNSGSGTLHMDTAVYSLNSNFGPNVYGFGVNRAIEFFETIKPLGGSSYSNGVLTVIFISGNKVNIKVGQGYDASAFYVARNPQPYNLIGYNAIFYRGAPPAQTVPAVCQVSLSVCGDPEKTAVSSPTTISSTISSTTASSTTKSSTTVSSSPTLSTTTLATSTRTSSSSSASTTITTSSASSKTLTSSSSTSSSTSSAFSTTSSTSASSTTGKSSTTGPSSSSTSQSDSSTTTVTTTASSTYSSSRSSILASSSTSSFVASTTTSSSTTSSSTTSSSTTSSSTTSSSTTSSSTIPTSSLDPSTSIVTTTSSTTTTTTTTTILPVSSTTTSITSASTPTGGVAGYDRQNPSASKVDTSGTYGTYDTCKAYCQGFLSFAVGSNACLCYAAPIANNVSPDPSSPYVFYDIPGAESSTSTSTTTTSMSTTASTADSQFSSTSTSSTVASSSLSTTASNSTTTSTTTPTTISTTASTTASATTPASSSTITIETSSIITSTSTSEIASTTTSITASATTSTTASTASSSPTGGVAGYDKQNPAAALTDSSGAYGTYDTCKTFCKNFVSFAVGAGTCLCYTAPIANNVSPVSSSPYIFYDMPGAAAGSSTSSTTTSVPVAGSLSTGDLPTTSSTQDISTTSSFTASTTTASISSSTSPSTSEAATATSSSTSTSTSTSSMASSTPTPSNLCPNNTPPSTSYTTTLGDIYGLCPNTDFPAGDSSNVVGVKSIQACADLCSSTSGCIAASLLRDSSTCYMKTTRNAAVVNDGVDSAYLIVSGGASSSTSMTTTTTTSAVGGSATS